MATETKLKAIVPTEGGELEGSLEVFKFPDILQFLSLNKTGMLHLSHNERHADLAFKDGKIVNVYSVDRYMRLGQMLISSGRLAARSLEEALEIQQAVKPIKFLGDILVEKEMIDMDELKSTIHLQIEEDLWDLFSWEKGFFKFENHLEREPEKVHVEIDVSLLLKEGARRMEEWQVLCTRIDNPKEVFGVNTDFSGKLEQPLDDKTWRVLSLINGRLTVEALVRLSNFGKFETYWALDHLVRNEVIVRTLVPGEAAEIDDEVLARESASAAVGEDSGEIKKGGKRGIFGRKKNSQVAESEVIRTSSSGPFLTDVGLTCSAVNDLMDLMEGNTALSDDLGNPVWLQKMWLSAEFRYPRADILKVDRRISPKLYEKYAQVEGGISSPLEGTHDDALEGLRLFWNKLVQYASEKLDDPKAAEQLAEKAAKPYFNSTAEIMSPEFSFLRWKEEGFFLKGTPVRTAVAK